jgi:hypothetical protein
MAGEKIPISLYGVNHTHALGNQAAQEFGQEVVGKKFLAFEALRHTKAIRDNFQSIVNGKSRIAPPQPGEDPEHVNRIERFMILQGQGQTLLFPDYGFREGNDYDQEVKTIFFGKDVFMINLLMTGVLPERLSEAKDTVLKFAEREAEVHQPREQFMAQKLATDPKLTKIPESARPANTVSFIHGAIHLLGLKKELAQYQDILAVTHTKYESSTSLSPYEGMVLLYRMGKQDRITSQLQTQALISEAVSMMISQSLYQTNNAPTYVTEDFAVKKVSKIIALSLSHDEMVDFLTPVDQQRFDTVFIERILDRMQATPYYGKGLRRDQNPSLAQAFPTIVSSLEQYLANI